MARFCAFICTVSVVVHISSANHADRTEKQKNATIPASVKVRSICPSAFATCYLQKKPVCDAEACPTNISRTFFPGIALAIGYFMITICHVVPISYTVLLYFSGLFLGLFGCAVHLGFITTALRQWTHFSPPEIFFHIFLASIVFDAALKIRWIHFRRLLIPIVIVALGFVLAQTSINALFIRLFVDTRAKDWHSWWLAFMFGAMQSVTEPDAILDALRDQGVSDRIAALIDGESLLNDASTVIWQIFMANAENVENPDKQYTIRYLCLKVFSSIACGALIGMAFCLFATCCMYYASDEWQVEVPATAFVALSGFWVAQSAIGMSGVVANVTSGLILSGYGFRRFSAPERGFIKAVWDFLAWAATTVVFVHAGLLTGVFLWPCVRSQLELRDYGIMVANYLFVQVLRVALFALAHPAIKWGTRNSWLTWQKTLVGGLSGMRGSVSMLLSLMVGQSTDIPNKVRSQVVLWTTGHVLLSHVLNGLLLPPLILLLGVGRPNAARAALLDKARARAAQETLIALDRLCLDAGTCKARWSYVRRKVIPRHWLELAEDDTGSDMFQESEWPYFPLPADDPQPLPAAPTKNEKKDIGTDSEFTTATNVTPLTYEPPPNRSLEYTRSTVEFGQVQSLADMAAKWDTQAGLNDSATQTRSLLPSGNLTPTRGALPRLRSVADFGQLQSLPNVTRNFDMVDPRPGGLPTFNTSESLSSILFDSDGSNTSTENDGELFDIDEMEHTTPETWSTPDYNEFDEMSLNEREHAEKDIRRRMLMYMCSHARTLAASTPVGIMAVLKVDKVVNGARCANKVGQHFNLIEQLSSCGRFLGTLKQHMPARWITGRSIAAAFMMSSILDRVIKNSLFTSSPRIFSEIKEMYLDLSDWLQDLALEDLELFEWHQSQMAIQIISEKQDRDLPKMLRTGRLDHLELKTAQKDLFKMRWKFRFFHRHGWTKGLVPAKDIVLQHPMFEGYCESEREALASQVRKVPPGYVFTTESSAVVIVLRGAVRPLKEGTEFSEEIAAAGKMHQHKRESVCCGKRQKGSSEQLDAQRPHRNPSLPASCFQPLPYHWCFVSGNALTTASVVCRVNNTEGANVCKSKCERIPQYTYMACKSSEVVVLNEKEVRRAGAGCPSFLDEITRSFARDYALRLLNMEETFNLQAVFEDFRGRLSKDSPMGKALPFLQLLPYMKVIKIMARRLDERYGSVPKRTLVQGPGLLINGMVRVSYADRIGSDGERPLFDKQLEGPALIGNGNFLLEKVPETCKGPYFVRPVNIDEGTTGTGENSRSHVLGHALVADRCIKLRSKERLQRWTGNPIKVDTNSRHAVFRHDTSNDSEFTQRKRRSSVHTQQDSSIDGDEEV